MLDSYSCAHLTYFGCPPELEPSLHCWAYCSTPKWPRGIGPHVIWSLSSAIPIYVCFTQVYKLTVTCANWLSFIFSPPSVIPISTMCFTHQAVHTQMTQRHWSACDLEFILCHTNICVFHTSTQVSSYLCQLTFLCFLCHTYIHYVFHTSGCFLPTYFYQLNSSGKVAPHDPDWYNGTSSI